MERFNTGITDIFKMEIDDQAKSNFIETARWAKFIAIVLFVIFGIFLLAGILLAVLLPSLGTSQQFASLGALGPVFIIFIVLILVGVYFYPTYALLKFSNNIREGLNTGNKEQFNTAIRHLKGMFKYMGIMMIVLLAIYGIEIVVGVVAATSK